MVQSSWMLRAGLKIIIAKLSQCYLEINPFCVGLRRVQDVERILEFFLRFLGSYEKFRRSDSQSSLQADINVDKSFIRFD